MEEKKKRQEYEKPKIILTPIALDDVITTSGGTDENPDYRGEWDPF